MPQPQEQGEENPDGVQGGDEGRSRVSGRSSPDRENKRSHQSEGDSNNSPPSKRKAATRADKRVEDGKGDEETRGANEFRGGQIEGEGNGLGASHDEHMQHSVNKQYSQGPAQRHLATEGCAQSSTVSMQQQEQSQSLPQAKLSQLQNHQGTASVSSPALSNLTGGAGLGGGSCLQGVPTYPQNNLVIYQAGPTNANQQELHMASNPQALVGSINLSSAPLPQALRTFVPGVGFVAPLVVAGTNNLPSGSGVASELGSPHQPLQQPAMMLPQQQHMSGLFQQNPQQVVLLNHGQLAGPVTLPATQHAISMLDLSQHNSGLVAFHHQQQAQQLGLQQMQQMVGLPQHGNFPQYLSSPQMQHLLQHNQLAQSSLNIGSGSNQHPREADTHSASSAADHQPAVAASKTERKHVDKTPYRRMLMYINTDDEVLSEYQTLLRKNIEYFEASRQELQTATPGRKKPIVLGQVGIRCIHCASLPVYRRTSAAVYFPARLGRLYQSAQNIGLTHFDRSCVSIDEEFRAKVKSYRNKGKKPSAGHGGKEYWSNAARASGVVETETDGLCFSSIVTNDRS